MIANTILLAASLTTAAPAAAESSPPEQGLEILISEASEQGDEASVFVKLRVLNATAEPAPMRLPDLMQAEIQSEGETHKVWLERVPEAESRAIVAAGGFASAGYRLREQDAGAYAGAILTIPAWSSQQVVIARTPAVMAVASAEPANALPDNDPPEMAATPPSDPTAGNAFLDNLSVYEPIYAVYGPGTNTAAKLQVSFQYRLFGSRRTEELEASWREGMHFAFTQRMFWDVGAESSPFRNIDYLPEFFYLSPSATLTNGMSLAGQAGIRHESNGQDGLSSRSLNTVYIAPMAAIPLPDGYELNVAPRLSLLVGDKGDNPDILDYRGTTSLFVELGRDDGLRLSTATRFNFATGKGAFSADLSYPLNKLLGGGPDLYFFGQSFIGYGENLLDYDHHTTRFRLGLAIVR